MAGQCALDPSDPRTIRLTKRELEVLSLVIEGRSSKDIAQTLNVSKRTIDVHLAAIYDKMQVSNRVQAMRRVVRLGLTTLAWIIHDVPVLMAVRRHVILRFAPNEAPRFGISGLGPEVVRYSPIYSRNACFADAPRMSS
ncbi:MAG: LuxR C-terminal-related transcriptional regulator [Armatimonadota bacterium]|nr:LuxR C-terminal-related transcriptional regulator [Armatimonadota bacterium]